MSIKHEENDVYVIPPNFIETGTIFGGTIKFRNAAEAVILSLLIGFPVFHLPVTLTTKIIIAFPIQITMIHGMTHRVTILIPYRMILCLSVWIYTRKGGKSCKRM